jgi:integrase
VNGTTPSRQKPRGRHPDRRLTVPNVRRLGPGRYADGNGLYLEVESSGARRWLLRAVVHGRRRDIGLGSAILVPLAEARELAARLRRVARSGGDPIAERDKDKRKSLTFAEAARLVHEGNIMPNNKNEKHRRQWITTLSTYAFPSIGSKPVHAVDQADILRVLGPIWMEKPETARRVRQRLRTVFDWALAAGHREALNPVDGVDKGLPRQRDRARHHAALPWQELPAFMQRLASLDGMGALALRFVILTAARSGEVRGATWEEIDLERAVWTVPARRMKMEREHRVPLSASAMEVLGHVRGLTASVGGLVFPSMRPNVPLSDMTLTAVLRRADVPVTVHGFRSTFRDWAEEAVSFPHEVKEAALAHTVKNKVEAAYRRTDLFAKRIELMNAWGSFATGAAPDAEVGVEAARSA